MPKARDMTLDDTKLTYALDEHHHRFAVWAASRAASVKGCRFSVAQGKAIINAVGLAERVANPPDQDQVDDAHRAWRNAVIEAAGAHGLAFTHGVAAKLINVYLKARHADQHPPIDAVLLTQLADGDFGGFRAVWQEARRIRWSHFTSDDYETVIHHARIALNGAPLWMLEEHWRGHQ
jgi:hypothetical protein